MREQRLKQIEDYLNENELCPIDTLCDIFKVSKSTIRRDIEELQSYGIIKKLYGGIQLNKKRIVETIPFLQREIKNIEAKEYMGQLASNLVNEKDTIFVDSGTTTHHIIKHVKDKKINIVTNNLNIINECIEYPYINVLVSGGELYRITNSFVGDNTINYITNYNISTAFMAATGVSINNGFTNSSPMETAIKKAAISKSISVYVMIDDSKWGIISLMTFAKLNDVNGIITNKKPPKEYMDYFTKNKISVLY